MDGYPISGSCWIVVVVAVVVGGRRGLRCCWLVVVIFVVVFFFIIILLLVVLFLVGAVGVRVCCWGGVGRGRRSFGVMRGRGGTGRLWEVRGWGGRGRRRARALIESVCRRGDLRTSATWAGAGVIVVGAQVNGGEERAEKVEAVVAHDGEFEVLRGERGGTSRTRFLGRLVQHVLHHALERLCDQHGGSGGDLSDLFVCLHHLLDARHWERGCALTTAHVWWGYGGGVYVGEGCVNGDGGADVELCG